MGVCTKERKSVTAEVLMATPCTCGWLAIHFFSFLSSCGWKEEEEEEDADAARPDALRASGSPKFSSLAECIQARPDRHSQKNVRLLSILRQWPTL